MASSRMKWLNEVARYCAYPLRATWVDRAYVLVTLLVYISLAVLAFMLVVEWLCA